MQAQLPTMPPTGQVTERCESPVDRALNEQKHRSFRSLGGTPKIIHGDLANPHFTKPPYDRGRRKRRGFWFLSVQGMDHQLATWLFKGTSGMNPAMIGLLVDSLPISIMSLW